jgi:hypothetical protein
MGCCERNDNHLGRSNADDCAVERARRWVQNKRCGLPCGGLASRWAALLQPALYSRWVLLTPGGWHALSRSTATHQAVGCGGGRRALSLTQACESCVGAGRDCPPSCRDLCWVPRGAQRAC